MQFTEKEKKEIVSMLERVERTNRRQFGLVRAKQRLQIAEKKLIDWLQADAVLLTRYREALESLERMHNPWEAFHAGQSSIRSGAEKQEAFHAYAARVYEEAQETIQILLTLYVEISGKLKSRWERSELDKYTAAYRAIHGGVTKSIQLFFDLGYERG